LGVFLVQLSEDLKSVKKDKHQADNSPYFDQQQATVQEAPQSGTLFVCFRLLVAFHHRHGM
jgi:hypothetical protein